MIKNHYARLLLDIEERIADQVKDIRWIDQYYGQDQTDLRPSLAFPAVLIEFNQTSYTGMGGYSQMAAVTLSIRLLLDNYSSSAQKSPQKAKETALRCYELEDAVVSALHGWTPDEDLVQPLIRVADESQNRNDIGLRTRLITFTTSWECYAPDGADEYGT